MSAPDHARAVAARVLTQLRRDHRTLAMLLVLPCLILTLLWWMFQDRPGVGFDALGPPLLALIPFIVMFLVTSVTTLRERSSGTLERLLAMPIGKGDFLLRLRARLRAGRRRAVGARRAALRLAARARRRRPGLDAASWSRSPTRSSARALGLFVSAFARTEFQAVQFMPALVIPQILLCGLFVPRDRCRRCSRRSPTCCRCPTPSTR